jgi:hypothetical protein
VLEEGAALLERVEALEARVAGPIVARLRG